MTREETFDVIAGLMCSEHLGDVHEQILKLCRIVGIPSPEGNYGEGWTDEDWKNVGVDA